jgi:hypothetical protein
MIKKFNIGLKNIKFKHYEKIFLAEGKFFGDYPLLDDFL